MRKGSREATTEDTNALPISLAFTKYSRKISNTCKSTSPDKVQPQRKEISWTESRLNVLRGTFSNRGNVKIPTQKKEQKKSQHLKR